MGLRPPLCIAFLGLWLGLFAPTIAWLGQRLSEGDSHLNLLMLTGLWALCGHRVLRDWTAVSQALRAGPRRVPAALLLLVVCALAFPLSHRLLSVHTLSAALFCLGSYGLIGLYLPPRRLRQGLPLVLLLLVLLPFQGQLDTYLGFPARVATANLVHRQLALFGVPSVSAESILLLDGGVAHVALPCSGMRSLWSGALFFLGATWLCRRRLDLSWLLCGAVLFCGLLLANATRVLFIVALSLCAHRPDVGDMVHVPLGVLGFSACCLLSLVLLRHGPCHRDVPGLPMPPPLSLRTFCLLTSGLLLLLLFCAASRPPALPPMQLGGELTLPAGWTTQPLPLSGAEPDLFAGHGGVLARKWRFAAGDISGSLLVAVSRSFRAHHAPQVCLAAAGLRVDAMTTVQLYPGLPVRQLSLRDPQGGALSAVYWFQSQGRTTDEILVRSLADLGPRHEPWALVSLVFDTQQSADRPQVREQLLILHRAVAVRLQGAVP